jgi:DNA-binding FadR family transcriptional regulator
MKLSDKVIAGIKKDIASGRLKKGEKIPAEPELMEFYQVGRSTIREAIKTLAIAGILKVQQGSGTFVASKVKDESLTQRLRRADFEEVNTIRAILENEMVRLACSNRTTADIEHLQELLLQRKKAIEAHQPKKCAEADIAFHTSIAKASGNQVLSDLYENFSLVLHDFFAKREENIEHFNRSQQSHEELAAAIADRDQRSAEQLIKSILHHNY